MKVNSVSIFAMTIVLNGCASLSSTLDLTHTETVNATDSLYIVTDLASLDQWRELFSNHWNGRSTETGVGLVKGAGIFRLTAKGDDFISSIDVEDGRRLTISYAHDFHSVCADAAKPRSKRELLKLFDNTNVVEVRVDEQSIKNCTNNQRTTSFWESIETSNILRNREGSPLAVTYTVKFDLDVHYDLKYKYVWAGTRCRDGSTSDSTGQGTCSWHNGVAGSIYRKRYIDETESIR